MAQSLSKIYLHIVFSTKHRFPFLQDAGVRSEMHAYIGGISRELNCPVLTVGGVADHVHVVSCLARTLTVAKLLEEMKKSSSKWVKSKGRAYSKFAWQNGYGVFSVSESNVETVRKYVGDQERHHRRRSFQDEYRELLQRYKIEYDERYVWD